MLAQNIILFSLRTNNFLMDDNTHGSDWTKAKLLTEDDARDFIKARLSHEGAPVYLPVAHDLLASSVI